MGTGAAAPAPAPGEDAAGAVQIFSGNASGSTVVPSDRSTARSIAFSSSRTLPGHAYDSSSPSASLESPVTGSDRFSSRLKRATNASASCFTSAARSRSGGTRRLTTLSR